MATYKECCKGQLAHRESAKWMKRQMNKWMRRLGKTMLDDAPIKKANRGYYS